MTEASEYERAVAAHDAGLVALHEWRPDGAAYDGVPDDLAEAAARSAEHCLLRHIPVGEVPLAREIPREALNTYSLNLRYA